MIQHGEPPYLECSSKGDKRFSAFYARPRSLNGRSIEVAYQALKRFADGSTGLNWKQAKGQYPVNADECARMYEVWWTEWVLEKRLLPVLVQASGLSDRFGQPGHVCQATVLWNIRCAALNA